MSVLIPYLAAQVQAFNAKWLYYLNKPPVVLTTLASDIHAKNNGYLIDGRYHPNLGMVHGPNALKPTDTYLNGTTGRTGFSFTRNSGIADDLWKDPTYDVWGILANDGGAGASYQLTQDAHSTVMQHGSILIRRGPPPPTSSPTAANCYTYVELCAGQTRNIRIAMRFNQAIHLEFTIDGGATWLPVGNPRSGMNDLAVTMTSKDFYVFYLKPNLVTGRLTVDTHDSGTLEWLPNDAYTLSHPRSEWLPQWGQFRITGSNGWTGFIVNPQRHGTANVTKVDTIPYPHPQAGNAWLAVNGLTDQPGQIISNSVVPSGGNTFEWNSQISLPDAGDGLGSDTPPEWSDGQLIIPPDWTLGVPGGVNSNVIVQLRISEATITETLDDNQRTFTLDGDCTINNDTGQYRPAAGHFAFTLYSSNNNGVTLYKRCEAIAGIDRGLDFVNFNCLNDLKMRFVDRSYQMGNGKDCPIGYELQLDKWCIWSAVRLLCHLAGVHNAHLIRLPDSGAIYIPPGAYVEAPYGRAESSCPYPVLGNGTGDNPIHVYGPNATPWQILQQLCQDISYPIYDGSGNLIRNVPYYMGFDNEGYFHFEPYDPTLLPVTCGFTDRNLNAAHGLYPYTTWFGLSENFTATYSVDQLRSELQGEGQDWITNELLVEHRDQPAYIKEALGFPVRLLMRQERWGSAQYLSDVMDGLQAQCSLPTALAAGTADGHIPGLYVGNRISILHPKVANVPVDYYLTGLQHHIHDGPDRSGVSHFVARALANF